MRDIVPQSQSLENITGLQSCGGAGGAGADRNIVDAHQQRLALDIDKAHVEVAGKVVFHVAVDLHVIQGALEFAPQVVAELLLPGGFGSHLFAADLARLAQANDARHVQRAAAHAALVTAAVDLLGQLNARIAPPHVQGAHSLRSINLVPAQGEKVDVIGLYIYRNLAHRLNGVGVEDHALLTAQLADLPDGLNDANFVVGVHDAHQDGFAVQGTLQVFDIDQAIGLDRQVGDPVAGLLQPLAGIQGGLVLGHLGNDVVATLAVHLGNTLDGQIGAFGGSGGEDDLLGGRTDQLGNLFASLLDALLGLPAEGVVSAGRITEDAGEIGHHGLQHARIKGRGGVVIHVDRQLDPQRERLVRLRDVHSECFSHKVCSWIALCASGSLLVKT